MKFLEKLLNKKTEAWYFYSAYCLLNGNRKTSSGVFLYDGFGNDADVFIFAKDLAVKSLGSKEVTMVAFNRL